MRSQTYLHTHTHTHIPTRTHTYVYTLARETVNNVYLLTLLYSVRSGCTGVIVFTSTPRARRTGCSATVFRRRLADALLRTGSTGVCLLVYRDSIILRTEHRFFPTRTSVFLELFEPESETCSNCF